VKLNILPVPSLYIFLLIILLFNNLDNIKTNLALHNFNPRGKNQLHFLSVKHTSVKKCVTYAAVKIFNNLPSNVLELQ
jgi:hypothetical protein